MSKKRKKAHPVQAVKPKGNVAWRQSAEEATLASKPHYNGFACGHGAHGSAKYSRARAKQAWQRQMRQEGASRGSFPFMGRIAGSARPQKRCCLRQVVGEQPTSRVKAVAKVLGRG